MRPAWVAAYLEIPFAEKGRTREEGLDCYGLVRLVFAEQRGIDLPSYAEDYATTTDAEEITALCRGEVATSWIEVPQAEAQLFDVVIMPIMGEPIHFALVLDPPHFLHTMKDSWSSPERWDSLIWASRMKRARVVRWQGQLVGGSRV